MIMRWLIAIGAALLVAVASEYLEVILKVEVRAPSRLRLILFWTGRALILFADFAVLQALGFW